MCVYAYSAAFYGATNVVYVQLPERIFMAGPPAALKREPSMAIRHSPQPSDTPVRSLVACTLR